MMRQLRLTAETTLTPATHTAIDTKQHFRADILPCEKHMFVVMRYRFGPGSDIYDHLSTKTPYKSIAENNAR